jgi:hypothetical protein
MTDSDKTAENARRAAEQIATRAVDKLMADLAREGLLQRDARESLQLDATPFLERARQYSDRDALAAGLSHQERVLAQEAATEIALERWVTVAPVGPPSSANVGWMASDASRIDSASRAFAAATEAAKAPAQEPPSRGVRRVNVNFSDQAYQTLERLARSTGKSMSDVLRDAIALKVWFEQTRAEGGHVLVERPDGKIREVISV